MMSSAFEDSLLDFDLSAFQPSSNNAVLQQYLCLARWSRGVSSNYTKQSSRYSIKQFVFPFKLLKKPSTKKVCADRVTKAISKTKRKIISTDITLRKYNSLFLKHKELEKSFVSSKVEHKQACIDTMEYREKYLALDKVIKNLEITNKDLELNYVTAQNKHDGMQSHAKQLEQLVKESETIIESLKVENLSQKANNAKLQKENEQLLKNTSYMRNIVFGKKKLPKEQKSFVLTRVKKSADDSIDSKEIRCEDLNTFDEVFSPNFEIHNDKLDLALPIENLRENKNAPGSELRSFDINAGSTYTRVDHDHDEDDGRGSSIAFSDSDKCFNSPEYFIDSPFTADLLRSKNKLTVNVSTSPLPMNDVKHVATSPIIFENLDILEGIEKNVSNEIKPNDCDNNIRGNMIDPVLSPIFVTHYVDVSTSPLKNSTNDAATSPVKQNGMSNCNNQQDDQNTQEKYLMKINNSSCLEDENSNDYEVQMIFDSMRLSEKLITPIPTTPAKSRNVESGVIVPGLYEYVKHIAVQLHELNTYVKTNLPPINSEDRGKKLKKLNSILFADSSPPSPSDAAPPSPLRPSGASPPSPLSPTDAALLSPPSPTDAALLSPPSPSDAALLSPSRPSDAALLSPPRPSDAALLSPPRPSDAALLSPPRPSIAALLSPPRPSDAALLSPPRPSDAALLSPPRPSIAALLSPPRPSDAALLSPSRPSDAALLSPPSSSDAALPSPLRPSDAALPSPPRPSDAALLSPPRPSDAALLSPSRPSDAALLSPPSSSDAALPSPLRPSDAALPSPLRPSDAALLSPPRPSDAALLSPPRPSIAALLSPPGSSDAALPSPRRPSETALLSPPSPSDAALPSPPRPSDGALLSTPSSSDAVLTSLSRPSDTAPPSPLLSPLTPEENKVENSDTYHEEENICLKETQLLQFGVPISSRGSENDSALSDSEEYERQIVIELHPDTLESDANRLYDILKKQISKQQKIQEQVQNKKIPKKNNITKLEKLRQRMLPKSKIKYVDVQAKSRKRIQPKMLNTKGDRISVSQISHNAAYEKACKVMSELRSKEKAKKKYDYVTAPLPNLSSSPKKGGLKTFKCSELLMTDLFNRNKKRQESCIQTQNEGIGQGDLSKFTSAITPVKLNKPSKPIYEISNAIQICKETVKKNRTTPELAPTLENSQDFKNNSGLPGQRIIRTRSRSKSITHQVSMTPKPVIRSDSGLPLSPKMYGKNLLKSRVEDSLIHNNTIVGGLIKSNIMTVNVESNLNSDANRMASRPTLKRQSVEVPDFASKRMLRSSSVRNDSTEPRSKRVIEKNEEMISRTTKEIVTYGDIDIFEETEKPTNELVVPRANKYGILCHVLDRYSRRYKKPASKLPENAINLVCKKIEDGIAEIRNLPDKDRKVAMDQLVKNLHGLKQKQMLAGIIKFLSEPARKFELQYKKYETMAPPLTEAEVILIYIVSQFKVIWPDIVENIMSRIEYSLFMLNRSPDCGVIETMAHFYAVLCRYDNKRARLRMFIIDAMYCMQFKALPLIKQCMEVDMKIFPLANMEKAKEPLVTCLVYLLHFFKCDDRKNILQDIRNLFHRKYSYDISDWNEPRILEMFRNYIMDLSDLCIHRSMLRLAFILLAKRNGALWCQNNIIQNMLLRIIDQPQVPDRVKQFCVSLLGPLLKPYPMDMKVNCEIVMNKLFVMLSRNQSDKMEEAIFTSLIHMSKHNPNRVIKALLFWKPARISRDMDELLKRFVQERPLKSWRTVILKFSVQQT